MPEREPPFPPEDYREGEPPDENAARPHQHGDKDVLEKIWQPTTLEDMERDVDPDVLPVFEQLRTLTRRLIETSKDENTSALEHEIDTLWSQFVDLVAEQGKRVHPQTLLALEMPMRALGRYEAANFLNRHMLALIPESAEARQHFGHELRRQGNDRLAEELYQQAIDFQVARLRIQESKEIDRLLEDPVELSVLEYRGYDPRLVDLGDSFQFLAEVQLRQGKYRDTVDSATSATKLYRVNEYLKTMAWQYLAEAQARVGDSSGAVRTAEQALAAHRAETGFRFSKLDYPVEVKGILRAAREGEEALRDYFGRKDQITAILKEVEPQLPIQFQDVLAMLGTLALYDADRTNGEAVLSEPLNDEQIRELKEDLTECVILSGRYLDKMTRSESGEKALASLRLLPRTLEGYREKAPNVAMDRLYEYTREELETLLLEAENRPMMEKTIRKIYETARFTFKEGT